jgi:hypothetical protein
MGCYIGKTLHIQTITLRKDVCACTCVWMCVCILGTKIVMNPTSNWPLPWKARNIPQTDQKIQHLRSHHSQRLVVVQVSAMSPSMDATVPVPFTWRLGKPVPHLLVLQAPSLQSIYFYFWFCHLICSQNYIIMTTAALCLHSTVMSSKTH